MTQRRRHSQSGQVMVEFSTMLVLCVIIAASLATMLHVFGSYGNRLIDMVCIGCP